MTSPFVIVLAFALGWVAAHVVSAVVHEVRLRAPNERAASLTRSARRR